MSSSRKSYIIGGILICLLGAICFSTKAIFVKLAYRDTDIDGSGGSLVNWAKEQIVSRK